MTTIAVSMLNFNGAAHTIACVHSLRRATQYLASGDRLKILIADNGSTDGDLQALENALKDQEFVEIHPNGGNLGFAAGHNRNLSRILSDDPPDYVWVLNNDCEVDENAPQALIDCARSNPQVGIWGATLLDEDGETIQCAGGCRYNPWLTTFRSVGAGTKLLDLDRFQSPRFDYIAGASLFFPVSTLTGGLSPAPGSKQSKVSRQWFNELYFLYFEELDLARRLDPRRSLAWCREAKIAHLGGAGTGTAKGRQPASEFHSTLSALLYSREYHRRRLWFILPARFTLKCVQLLMAGRVGLIRELVKAYRAFFAFRSASMS